MIWAFEISESSFQKVPRVGLSPNPSLLMNQNPVARFEIGPSCFCPAGGPRNGASPMIQSRSAVMLLPWEPRPPPPPLRGNDLVESPLPASNSESMLFVWEQRERRNGFSLDKKPKVTNAFANRSHYLSFSLVMAIICGCLSATHNGYLYSRPSIHIQVP